MTRSTLADRVREALEGGRAEDIARESSVATTYLAALSSQPDAQEVALARLRSGESPYSIAGRYPLETVTGVKDLTVRATVMPPGGDTQLVANLVSALATGIDELIIDVGCGTGVLGIAALAATSSARALFIDLAWDACGVAWENLRGLGLARRAAVVRGRGLESLRLSDSKALLIANLPFVPTNALPFLPSRYGRFAPRLAVDGGADGLAAVRIVVNQATVQLAPGSILVLQHGEGQSADVARVLGERWRIDNSRSMPVATVATLSCGSPR